ncbi:DUF6541 domain-containing protein [Actinomyces slackii]|uniref:Uncharacterized protein n=1 Tax=Actinomyces slackii TaxID=52774 RepID=A0A3S4SRA3_9ACTO|nr:DUF6541 family protein [Actinomyces slackii]VEG75874.1 Uncharacterised protein [Actinomyces slackii]
MLEWIGALTLAVLLLAVLVLPGSLVLGALGVRTDMALAAGPGVSIIVITASTVALARVGVPWNGVSSALILGGISAISAIGMVGRVPGAVGVARHARLHRAEHWLRLVMGHAAPIVLGILLTALPQLIILARVLRSPAAVLQNHDAMFHLNYIAQIMTFGNASPFGSSWWINGGSYYPNLWHAVAALHSGTQPTVAFNVMAIMVSALLAPLGCIVLARSLGGGPLAQILAGAAGSGTAWFPGYMLYLHAQAPTALAIALIPFSLAAAILWRRDAASTPIRGALAVVASVVGTGIAHAGAGQLLVVVSAVGAVVWSLRGRASWLQHRPWGPWVRFLPAVGGAAALALMVSSSMLRLMGDFPQLVLPVGQTALRALTLAPMEADGGALAHAPLAVLALIGLVLLVRRGQWAMVTVWAGIVALDIITALPRGWWRALVGAWWNDEHRIKAVLVVLAGVLAAYAADRLMRMCLALVRQRSVARRFLAVGAAVLVVVPLVVSTAGSLRLEAHWARLGYDPDSLIHAPWVTDEEVEFIRRVARELPDDAVVYGYPGSGSGLMPVLTGTRSVHRALGKGGPSGTSAYMIEHFDQIATDPKVCELIRQTGGTPVYYADQDVDDYVVSAEYPGYDQVDTSQGFSLIDAQGTASVWLITACD